jgi:hypothetical protein
MQIESVTFRLGKRGALVKARIHEQIEPVKAGTNNGLVWREGFSLQSIILHAFARTPKRIKAAI